MGTTSVFTHEVGFYGYVKMATAPSAPASVTLIATGGDVSVNTDPIFSSGVWGAGWYTAANQIAYAVNALRIEGSISYELSAGNVFNAIKSFGFENRADKSGHNIELLPQGKSGFKGPAWCSSASFDASTDSLVTGSLNFSSGSMQSSNWVTDIKQPDTGTKNTTGEAPSSPLVVYPFWATSVELGETGSSSLSDIISWSANYSSEVNFLTLCNGLTTNPVAPDYIMIGGMDADGQFSILSISGQLNPNSFQSSKSITIKMRPGSALSSVNKIEFSKVLFNNGSTSIQTGGQYIQSDISFTAVGDGTKPPMSVS